MRRKELVNLLKIEIKFFIRFENSILKKHKEMQKMSLHSRCHQHKNKIMK